MLVYNGWIAFFLDNHCERFRLRNSHLTASRQHSISHLRGQYNCIMEILSISVPLLRKEHFLGSVRAWGIQITLLFHPFSIMAPTQQQLKVNAIPNKSTFQFRWLSFMCCTLKFFTCLTVCFIQTGTWAAAAQQCSLLMGLTTWINCSKIERSLGFKSCCGILSQGLRNAAVIN